MKKTTRLSLLSVFIAFLTCAAMLFGFSLGSTALAEDYSAERQMVYSSGSNAFSRAIKTEGTSGSRKITFESSIYCSIPTATVAVSFFGKSRMRMQDPTENILGTNGLSLYFVGTTLVLPYNTFDGECATTAESEMYKAFVSSTTQTTVIEISELSGDGIKIAFYSEGEELVSCELAPTDFPTPLGFSALVDAEGYSHLCIATSATWTDSFEFGVTESVNQSATPILYDNGEVYDGTIEITEAYDENGVSLYVGEIGTDINTEKGYSVCAFAKTLVFSNGMVERRVQAGETFTFPKTNYIYSSTYSALGTSSMASGNNWSYYDRMGGTYYPASKTEGLSIDIGVTFDKITDSGTCFGINIAPTSQILWPGTTVSDVYSFTLWFTERNGFLYASLYGHGGWNQYTEDNVFEYKFRIYSGTESKITIKIMPVDGVWGVYFYETGDTDGYQLTSKGALTESRFPDPFDFNGIFGSNFINDGGGCNVALMGWNAEGEIALYSLRTEFNVTSKVSYSGSTAPVYGEVIAAYDAYGREIAVYESSLTSTGFTYTLEEGAGDVIAAILLKTTGGITKLVSAFAKKVTFEAGNTLTVNSNLYIYESEISVYNASTGTDITDKINITCNGKVATLNNLKGVTVTLKINKAGYGEKTLANVAINSADVERSISYTATIFSASFSIKLADSGEYVSTASSFEAEHTGDVTAVYNEGTHRFVFTGLTQDVVVTAKVAGYYSATVTLTSTDNYADIVLETLDLTEWKAFIEDAQALKDSVYVSTVKGQDVMPKSYWCTQAAADELEAAITAASQRGVYSDSDLTSAERDLQAAVVKFEANVSAGTYGTDTSDIISGNASGSYIACKTAIGIEVYLAPVFIGLALAVVLMRVMRKKKDK